VVVDDEDAVHIPIFAPAVLAHVGEHPDHRAKPWPDLTGGTAAR
jgi:hypothetical protein